MNGLRLTTRGKTVIAIGVIGLTLAASLLIRDVCWVGNGYGSCQALQQKYQPLGEQSE